MPGLLREPAVSVRSVKEEGSTRENIMYHCIANSALLIVIVSGRPSVPSPQTPCENHPCGWIKYHNSNWNSFNAFDVIENTL